MAKLLIVLDAYMRNPKVVTVLKEFPNGSLYGDDANGVRTYVTKERIMKIPLPDKGK